MLLRLQFTAGIQSDRVLFSSADLCEFNNLQDRVRPEDELPNCTYAYGTPQLSIYANALFELAMKNCFPSRLMRSFHKELNHNLLCSKHLLTTWLVKQDMGRI